MNTAFWLMGEFETTAIPLEEVRKRYLNLSKPEADRKAKQHKLPFPVFRTGGQRAPWFVHLNDLAEYLDKQRESSRKSWEKISAA